MNSLRNTFFGSQQPSSDPATIGDSHARRDHDPTRTAAGASEPTQDVDMATDVRSGGAAVAEGAKVEETAVPCPDPSVHESTARSAKLQDQASKAALYVTQPEKTTEAYKVDALGPDGKLSSAGMTCSSSVGRRTCATSLLLA
jgi:hypothetical protein